MKVQSLRLGFATNSSSSHSVVLTDAFQPARTQEEVASNYRGNGETEFGWGYETHSDLDSIVNYGVLLYIAYQPFVEELQASCETGSIGEGWLKRTTYDQQLWEEGVNSLLISEPTKTILKQHGPEFDGYIDHQSHEPHEGAVGDWEKDFWDFVTRCLELVIDNDNH